MPKIDIHLTDSVSDLMDISYIGDIELKYLPFMWIFPIKTPLSTRHYLYFAETMNELMNNKDFVGNWTSVGQPTRLRDIDYDVLMTQYVLYKKDDL